MKWLYTALLMLALAAITLLLWQKPLEPTPPASVPPAPTQSSVPTEPVPANTVAEPVAEPGTLPETTPLFADPLTPAVYELPSGALATWRQYAASKPVLVLFSAHPLLAPLHAEDRQAVVAFVKTAPPKELVRRGRALVADPMLISPQTVSAAIAAGLISELVYVQPTTLSLDKVSLTGFQERAFAAGFLTRKETLALTLKDGVISGTVRGTPLRVVHPDALPKLTQPTLVHIDLGYFKDLFVNDIKTPVYDLLYRMTIDIRESDWPTLAATLSYSNHEAEFSLATRFMISNLADIMEKPDWLVDGAPITWKMRADAAKTRAMFAESEANEMIEQAVAVSPADPDLLYELSQVRFTQQRPEEGFTLLDRAVAIDSGYALAYLELAEAGVPMGKLEKAAELLAKAVAALPDHPFIRIGQADMMIRRNRGAEALPILHELQALPWSPAYHPGTPGLLREMQGVAEGQVTSAQ